MAASLASPFPAYLTILIVWKRSAGRRVARKTPTAMTANPPAAAAATTMVVLGFLEEPAGKDSTETGIGPLGAIAAGSAAPGFMSNDCTLSSLESVSSSSIVTLDRVSSRSTNDDLPGVSLTLATKRYPRF